MKNLILAAAAALGLAAPALADEVRLRNGSVLEGLVHEKDNAVVIELDAGTVTIPRADVLKIVSSDGPLKELAEREKNARDPRSLHDLAVWAEKQGLTGRARDLHRRVLEIDPNHKESRVALGYVFQDGRWMTQDELMAARGLVRYEGRWVTADERAKEEQRLFEMQQRTDRAQAEQEGRRRAETARAALERARLDALRQNALWTSWVPVPWGPVPYSPYRVSGYAESQQLPLSGVPQQLPLSGVPQQLPLSGVPQQLPLAGSPVLEAR